MMRDQPPLLSELPYTADSADLFQRIALRPWAIYLDSGFPGSTQGRYDIMACDPVATLVTRGAETLITQGEERRVLGDDPFSLLREMLGPRSPCPEFLPCNGGAIGYFGYDLARRIERLPEQAVDDDRLPEMMVGIYDWVVVCDHRQRRCWLAGEGRAAGTRERWGELTDLFSQGVRTDPDFAPFRVTGPVRSNMSAVQYADAFARIQHYIREGDCYQVNFAQRFSVPVVGEPWLAYRRLRQLNPAPYAAYLNLPELQVLSSSPESFLRLSGNRVETRPIKGTLGRGATPVADRLQAETLSASAKDRAENLMIVDLLRNDLGKTCHTGSIEVPELFKLESYATVHHLVSTVTGRLGEGEDALSLLRGCFPGGSITGAPKLRAMEIIEELEPHRRGLYCGSIGYIGYHGDMQTNIAIRTLAHHAGVMRFWAGGGLVADSLLESEYRETYIKIAALMELLGQPQQGG